MGTLISWADETWNPLLGCTRVSAGCDGCYAIRTANVRASNPNPKVAAAFAGLVDRDADGRLDWTGQVNLLPDRLDQPLRWRKPKRIFVNSQSDLFHAEVPDEYIARIFAVMVAAPRHTFQVLTKRHARMRSLLNSPTFWSAASAELGRLWGTAPPAPLRAVPEWIWMGVSVESQQWVQPRLSALQEIPASVRWMSAEPLLGAVDVSAYLTPSDRRPRIDWVVVGGESGPGARPMHPLWVARLREQAVAAGVPFFFKQWGEWSPMASLDGEGRYVWKGRHALADDGTLYKPGEIAYPDGPRYGEAVRADHGRAHLTAMYRVGTKAAGDELDGRTWHEFPRNLRAVSDA